MVLVIDREVIKEEGDDARSSSPSSVAERVAALEAEGLDPRAASKRAARELGLSRDEAYRRLTSERERAKR